MMLQCGRRESVHDGTVREESLFMMLQCGRRESIHDATVWEEGVCP